MSLITLTNACYKYGKHKALTEISLDTCHGELMGIIGPNGSGKSTLLKLMAGLLTPCSGQVSLDGSALSSYRHDFLARKIALVPQSIHLPELFSALEIVLMGRTPHIGLLRYESKHDISIALKAMATTQISHLANNYINQLSGGEKQRVIIARALAQEADILLLDEPTSNLDVNYQVEILNFLCNLCRNEHMTVVTALHDLNLASQYCNRLVMLKEGRIFKQGTPDEIITRELIKEVFGLDVYIGPHPLNGLPTTLVSSNRR